MKRIVFVIASLLSLSAMAADKQAVLDRKSPCNIEYPKASLMNEESGMVAMNLLVAADGKVLESKLTASSGHKNLDKAALSSILKCKFIPAANGQQWQAMEYVWKLD